MCLRQIKQAERRASDQQKQQEMEERQVIEHLRAAKRAANGSGSSASATTASTSSSSNNNNTLAGINVTNVVSKGGSVFAALKDNKKKGGRPENLGTGNHRHAMRISDNYSLFVWDVFYGYKNKPLAEAKKYPKLVLLKEGIKNGGGRYEIKLDLDIAHIDDLSIALKQIREKLLVELAEANQI